MSIVDLICESAREYAESIGVLLLAGQVPYGAVGDIQITDLFADVPGRGDGTRALQNLCDLADEYGHNLYLSPATPRNKTYYERFGFEREERLKYPGLYLVRYCRENCLLAVSER